MRSEATRTSSPGLPRVLAARRARHSAWLRPAGANRAPVASTIGAALGAGGHEDLVPTGNERTEERDERGDVARTLC